MYILILSKPTPRRGFLLSVVLVKPMGFLPHTLGSIVDKMSAEVEDGNK